jgi:hypothetical protein
MVSVEAESQWTISVTVDVELELFRGIVIDIVIAEGTDTGSLLDWDGAFSANTPAT